MTALELDAPLFDSFRREVYSHTGITMDDTKLQMLRGRVRRRARARGAECLREYLKIVRSDPSEAPFFVDAVTTNTTSMFRTASVWKYLHEDWLPQRKATTPPKAWSAASSTGMEAASMAVLFESHPQRARGWRIVATDISQDMVQRASRQRFQQSKVVAHAQRSPVANVVSHFTPCPDDSNHLQLRPALRRQMQFEQHNLLKPAAVHTYDLVMVRNVTIYFSAEDKEKILHHCVRSLKPGGLLVIGESESLGKAFDHLERRAHCIYGLTP